LCKQAKKNNSQQKRDKFRQVTNFGEGIHRLRLLLRVPAFQVELVKHAMNEGSKDYTNNPNKDDSTE